MKQTNLVTSEEHVSTHDGWPLCLIGFIFLRLKCLWHHHPFHQLHPSCSTLLWEWNPSPSSCPCHVLYLLDYAHQVNGLLLEVAILQHRVAPGVFPASVPLTTPSPTGTAFCCYFVHCALIACVLPCLPLHMATVTARFAAVHYQH